MPTFTPGPWKYGLGYRVRPDRGLDADGREVGGPTICEVNADADRCCPAPDEVEANGRLIAAAPEMFAALQRASELFAELSGSGVPVRAVWNECRAAIAKAEGK